MKALRNIWFVSVVALLVLAVACTDDAVDPAVEPGKGAQAAASSGEEAEGPSDPPNITDFIDEATARQFEQMTTEWQTMARDGWTDITGFAPREDWAEAAEDVISKTYANAKIQGGIRDVAVTGVKDIVDPSKGASPDGPRTPPFVLSLLSPEYTEAYSLMPEGSLMREYLDIRLGRFSERAWESIKAEPDEPYSVPPPKLNAADEFELHRMLTSAGDAGWLIRKLRSLDADAARRYEATQDVTARLAVIRKLVEVDGKGQGVEEIRAEWGARSHGLDEEKVAAFVEVTRIRAAEAEARSRMTPRQQVINHLESMLCQNLMTHVVGQEPRSANSSPGQCDIAKVIALTKKAVETGKMASSEEELREVVTDARQNPGG